jgi:hypothetical protein
MVYGMARIWDAPRRYKEKVFEKYTTTWTEQAITELVRLIDECPVYYLDDISKKLKTKFRRNFSTSSISKMLIRKGYTRKVVYPKAVQQRAQEKANFLSTLRHHLKAAELAIFVDESNKDRKDARRKYGWSKVGTPVNYRALFNMDTRYTLYRSCVLLWFRSNSLRRCSTQV